VCRSASFLPGRRQVLADAATLPYPVLDLLDELVEIGEGMTSVLRRQIEPRRAGHIPLSMRINFLL
jgi:hypothetical protein